MKQSLYLYAEYDTHEEFLSELSPERLLLKGAQIIAAVGLQEVEIKKIGKTQLRRVIVTYKVHKKLHLDVKSLNSTQLFQYAAYTFLKFKVVAITEGWTDTLSEVTRKTVKKTGTY